MNKNEKDFISIKLLLAILFILGSALFLPTIITWAIVLGDKLGGLL